MPTCAGRTVSREMVVVVAAFSVFFLGTVAATILGKLTTIEAPVYPFALTMLSPIAGLIVYPAVVVGLIAAGFMPKETRQVPLWKAAVVGVLFCLHNVLENLGNRGNVVPGPIALILLKSIVPITFAGTYLVRSLRPVYRWTHYLAVVMLLAGIATTLGSSLGTLHGFSFDQAAGYMVLLLTSVLPLAAAFIFIEVQLKRRHPRLHPTYLWAVVCVFEALVSIPLAFVSAALQNLAMSDVLSNTRQGMACLVLGSPAGPRLMPGDGGQTVVTVDCGRAHMYYLAGLVPGFALNFAMPLCAKYGSATAMWFVRALALPVASILFAVPAIMGLFAARLTGWEWGGLALVFAANVVYNAKSSTPALGDEEDGHDHGARSVDGRSASALIGKPKGLAGRDALASVESGEGGGHGGGAGVTASSGSASDDRAARHGALAIVVPERTASSGSHSSNPAGEWREGSSGSGGGVRGIALSGDHGRAVESHGLLSRVLATGVAVASGSPSSLSEHRVGLLSESSTTGSSGISGSAS